MTRTSRSVSYDAIIVGARCAGAATALLLARRGLRVLAVDKSAPGTDTLSTHALMRPAVQQLTRWGVIGAVRAAGTPAIRQTSFSYAGDVMTFDIEPRDGVDALYAPRRTVLDGILARAAAAAGAEVRYGVRVADLLRDDDRVAGVRVRDADGAAYDVRAPIVIGADGIKSTVARLVDAPVYRRGANHLACAYAYYEGLPTAGNEWFFAPGGGAGAIPTNAGRTCLFLCVSRERLDRDVTTNSDDAFVRALATVAPDLIDRVRRARRVEPFRRFRGANGFMRAPSGPGWALVGDAGYFRDPITAHGITDALRDAELLASAVIDGSDDALARYHVTRDDLCTRVFELSDAIAGLDWDIPTIGRYHMELSKEMNREGAYLAALDERESLAA